MTYGPWSPGLCDEVERGKQLRSLQALAAVYLGSTSPLIAALREAEHDGNALVQAGALLDRVPSLTRRRMFSTFATVTWPPSRRPQGERK